MASKLSPFTFQFVWTITEAPADQPPLTHREIITMGYADLVDVADDHDCVITGPPLWYIQAAADTAGYEAYAPGRVLRVLVPVEYFPLEAAPEQPAPAEEERRALYGDELDAKVAELNAAGLRDREIADAVRRSTYTVYNSRQKQGLKPPGTRTKAEFYTKVAELHALGRNDREIALTLNRSISRVREARVDQELPANAKPGGRGGCRPTVVPSTATLKQRALTLVPATAGHIPAKVA